MEVSPTGNRRICNGMNIRNAFKQTASRILIPLAQWYLRKERKYQYKGTIVSVFPGVFHPGLFYSTRFLLSYLEKQNIKEKLLLELGCGTGLISIRAAKQGAVVTASDLNQLAVDNCITNAVSNSVSISTYHSNLFLSIPQKHFDWIIINPPYYAKPIRSNEELAWNCGEDFEYFKELFFSLKNYIHQDSFIIMVLTLGCDISAIQSIAKINHFTFELIAEKKVLFDEKDFLFKIRKVS